MADLLQFGSGGGGGGTTNYNQLSNKPQINGITVQGAKVAADYNLATNTGLDAVREIAEGAQQAVSFTNYEAMVETLNEATEDEYKTGQSIYIETVKVPDVWISQISDTSVPYTYTTDEAIVNALDTAGFLKIGYYRICKLETGKVDMNDYVLKTTKVNGEALSTDVTVTFGNLGGYPSDNTELASSLGSKEDKITGAASTITSDNLTSNRALVSNGSGKVSVSSSITATELGYLDGVTSSVQTQLDGKVSDVKINGTSIKVDGVADIPIASNNNLGLIRAWSNLGGINVTGTGQIYIIGAANADLESKSSGSKPVVCNNLDKAVMEGLGNNSLTWSSAYKTSAQNKIGITTESFVFTMADGTEITKNIKVSN